MRMNTPSDIYVILCQQLSEAGLGDPAAGRSHWRDQKWRFNCILPEHNISITIVSDNAIGTSASVEQSDQYPDGWVQYITTAAMVESGQAEKTIELLARMKGDR